MWRCDGHSELDQLFQPLAPFLSRKNVVGVLEHAEAAVTQNIRDALRTLRVPAGTGQEDLGKVLGQLVVRKGHVRLSNGDVSGNLVPAEEATVSPSS